MSSPRAANEVASERFIDCLSDASPTDASVRNDLTIRDGNFLLDRITILIKPAEGSAEQVSDESHDPAGGVRNADIQKLVRAINEVCGQVLKTGERFLRLALVKVRSRSDGQLARAHFRREKMRLSV